MRLRVHGAGLIDDKILLRNDRGLGWRLAFIAGLLWFLPHSVAAAETAGTIPRLTSSELAKRLLAELAPGGGTDVSEYVVVPPRHIDPALKRTGEAAEHFKFSHVETMAIQGDAARIVLLVRLDPATGDRNAMSLLALFAVAPGVRLLDVVEVGSDRWTGFRDKPQVSLGLGVPLIVIDTGHDNSNQNYLSSAMMFVRGNRFRLIDQVFTFSDSACTVTNRQSPSFVTISDSGLYRAIRVVVRETVTPTGEVCETAVVPRAGVTFHRAVYRWDGRRERFVTRSRALIALQARNATRW